MNRASKIILFVSSIVASAVLAVYGQNMNGTLNSGFYGSALAVQTINTGFGNALGGNDSAGGSEWDAAYGTISGGNLWLFLAGNSENNGNHLNVFVDGGSANGQSTLNLPATATMATMNGSVFSPAGGGEQAFLASFCLDMNNYHGTLYTEEYTLSGPQTFTGGYVGALPESSTGIAAGSDGGVSMLYLNNNNASTMGASGGAANQANMLATSTGLELQIPLSAISYTGGSIYVLVDENGGGDNYLSNQFLPGLPVGYGNLASPTFNFGTTPSQYFVVVPEPSSIALVVVGLLGAIGLIRRRK